ncbi:MAG: alpha-2-macroglobulin family protein [Chitinophagaceae bacterium]
MYSIKKAFLLLTPFLIYSFCSMAQNNEKKYDSLWKKVESLANKKGLTQSALIEVDKIYLTAKKEKKVGQLIKALLYQLTLRETLEENDVRASGITALEKEINTSTEPVSSILNSILAEKYLFYFQQHRWQLYGRTETLNFKKDDVATWSVTDFHKKISSLYLASITNKKLLQQTKLEPYDAIIIKGNARYLRPTMFDLLAHRALNYFRSDEREIAKPAYAFEIKDEKLFLPAVEFSTLNIVTGDSLSLHHKALLICQDLLTFHAADARPDALIDADIIRIEIVHQFAVMENKETLYATALDQLFSKYPLEPAAAKAAWLLAQWHVNKATSYDPLKDTSNRYEYIQALNICEKIIKQNQQSEGKSNCLSLINQVHRKELNLQTEKVNIPNQPFRTFVSFRNFTKLYLRIIPLTGDLQKQLKNRYDENYWKQLISLPPTRNWNQSFPSTNDYQRHNAEIKIDALPVGAYVLLASVNENYSLEKNPLAVQLFHVSNISYVNNGNDYFMLDRDNGKPLAKAAVQLWFNIYDFNQRKDVLSKGQQVITDNNGFVHLPVQKNANENNLQLEVHYRNDRLFMNDYQYRVFRGENENTSSNNKEAFEKEKARVFFFLDRSIYRPGQTVYFKGIAITEDFETRKTKVLSTYKSLVKLLNANGEQSDSLQVTTNEFGSYNGHFKLPQQTLNGEFRLQDEVLNGEASLSVEEYKRPKFYVEYEKLLDTYRVNDSIVITGFAKAYAGNNIDGANVKYRVVRTPRFIYPWLYWKWGMPRASNMEITNGIVSTDADGKFTIQFKAIPDLTVDKKFEPVFDYKVIADITDINGETRSGETTISVSYKAIQLKVNIASGEAIPLDSLKNISISTKNMNGEFVSTAAHVIINKLASPDRLIRKRYWPQPDQFIINKETYQRLFPNDEYENETNPTSWSMGEKVYDRADSTKANTRFELQPAKLTPGWYSVEVTTRDKYGEEVKDKQYIQLYDEKNNKLPSTIYSWRLQRKPAVEPGEKSTISIGSSASDLFIVQQVEKQSKVQSSKFKDKNDPDQPGSDYRFINLSNEIKSFDFPVTEIDRGGFGVFHFFVKNNRFYFISDQVNVPWTNKELTISYESFRNKMLPGSEEKWKLKISGSKNEKLAAEMLVSMYDASLDQFMPHSWAIPDIWPSYTSYKQWNGIYNFSAIQSQERYSENDNGSFFRLEYDALAVASPQLPMQIRGGAPGETVVVSFGKQRSMAPTAMSDIQLQRKEVAPESESSMADSVVPSPSQQPIQTIDPSIIQIRKNFNETAFFLPDLQTDSSGNISFGFTIPEALTRWKFQAMTHTKEAAFGYSTKDIITQKQLMVQPNAPRFLREGDHLELSTKIVNMTDKELTGTIHLELLNATDMKPVDGWFQNMTANQYFTAEAGKSVAANFSIQVPYQYNSAVVYRFVAKSTGAEISDGEEASLPVLTNSMLVTESLPLLLRGNTTRNYRFEKLLQSGASETLQQHSLTVEFTSNPAWYAVQALPYLIDYPYECSEQTFNRFYANALATKIVNASPRIKAIFEKWKSSDEKGLVSNLEKNPELKSVLLEETPWVLEAKTETRQMKDIALLFDMVRMSAQLDISIGKLQQLQSPNGGFSWFKGGPDDRYITQYIITGIGHLKKLAALPASTTARLNDISSSGIAYLDKRLKEDYDNLLKSKSDLKKNNTGYLQIQYLYMRSFFNDRPIPAETTNAATYYRKQSKQFWLQQNRYMQGMIALVLNRTGDPKTADDILKSLQQNAIVNEESGMYWKEGSGRYYWYQAPIEIQSLLIEAFSEIGNNSKIVDNLKTWLLRQKQTQNWKTTKATADACYALLLQGTDWLSAEPAIEIKLGNKIVKSTDEQQQAGTGYFKKLFDSPFVDPAMGEISIKASSSASAVAPGSKGSSTWGAVYWQYFEKLDKITPSSTPLKLTKKLFVEKNSDRGPVLEPITEGASIKVGDKIKVRIELSVDRDMEYVHMKDMRAGCMEPVNVLSGYKWQGGLGYYESTKDASTNFFFNWLPKGIYVFEYPLFVNQTGNFSNGVSSIQCMYAPEFASHSEGIRVTVE